MVIVTEGKKRSFLCTPHAALAVKHVNGCVGWTAISREKSDANSVNKM